MVESEDDQVIVVGPDEVAAAIEAVERADGFRVVHRYESLLVVAAEDGASADALVAALPDGLHPQLPGDVTSEQRGNLDEVALLVLEALEQPDANTFATSDPAGDGTQRRIKAGCVRLPSPTMSTESEQLISTRPTSSRLTGSVAVGLVMISGPTRDLMITDAERRLIVNQTRFGAQWLGNQPPQGSRVTWHWAPSVISIDVAAAAPAYNDESRWLDPALASLGYGPGYDGVLAYVNALRDRLRTQWTYAAFFKKYPPLYDGYATGPPNFVVMDPRNGDPSKPNSWKPIDTYRIFAHETGHVFGAPDEYGMDPKDPKFKPGTETCHCDQTFGIFNRPNTNCEWCASNGGQDCVMRTCDLTLCAQTPWHLGFANLSPG